MFNRSSFNKTAFNSSSSTGSSGNVVNFKATIQSVSNAFALRFNNKVAYSAVISAYAAAFADYTAGVKFSAVVNGMGRAYSTRYIRGRYMGGGVVVFGDAFAVALSGYDEEVMRFVGLSMMKGDELIIDTYNMTVTINGQNAIDKITDDSVFFFIEKGASITVEPQGTADITVLWKDRWL